MLEAMFENLYGEKAKFMLMADRRIFLIFKIKFLINLVTIAEFCYILSAKHIILHFYMQCLTFYMAYARLTFTLPISARFLFIYLRYVLTLYVQHDNTGILNFLQFLNFIF